MRLLAATQLGPYKIIAPIGAGGMGEVYRAHDPRLRRDVAIKIVSAQWSADPERLRRFEREARTAGGLNHPGIVTVLDVGYHEGSPYIVTELLEGESLRQRLGRGRLTLNSALDYATQIARGLAAAHERGITHRDLKPENLFVTKDGRIKILDFGLATASDVVRAGEEVAGGMTAALTRSFVTVDGAVLGTVGYMSPEQVRGQAVDQRSDIFALGVILSEMLSGFRPFRGQSAGDVMSAVLNEEPALDAPISPGLQRMVRACLAKDPAHRFQSASDIALTIEALHEKPAIVPAAGVGLGGLPRRNVALLAAAALIVVGVATSLAFLTGWRAAAVQISPSPTFTRLTFREGFIWSARFAPDGRTVIYSASWAGGPPDVYVTSPDSPESRSLGFSPADLLAVSKSGELALSLSPTIGSNLYLRSGVLARVPLTGGAPRELAENVRAADWSPDGKELAVVRLGNPGPSRLEYPLGHTLYEGGDLWWPHVSPSGDRVAFFERRAGRYGLALVDLSGHKTDLGGSAPDPEGVVWSKSGDALWVGLATTGQSADIHAVDLAGHWRRILHVPAFLELHDVSADGRFLITRLDQRSLTAGLSPGDVSERDLSWLERTSAVDATSDGRTILIAENGDGGGPGGAVYVRKTDGSPAKRLGSGLPLALSPDGQWVLAQTGTSPLRLTLLPTGPGELRVLQTGPLEFVLAGAWFPDGRRILLVGSEPGRGNRLYTIEQSGNEPPRPESPEGMSGRWTLISPDAKLVATGGPNTFLWPVGGKEPINMPGLEPGEIPINWTADGRELYVFRPSNLPARVFRVNVKTGSRMLWKEIAPADRAGVSGINRVLMPRDAPGAYFYSYLRTLNELYVAEGLPR